MTSILEVVHCFKHLPANRNSKNNENSESSESDYPKISVEALKQQLARPSKGDSFSIQYDQMKAPALELISKAKWIKVISCKNCEIENESLGKLSRLDLVCIRLNYTDFNDIGASGLPQCKTMTEIDASSAGLSDEGLKHLIKLKGLERLSIGGSKVSKTELVELARCENLAQVQVRECEKIGPNEVNVLRIEFPKKDFQL